MQDRRQSAMSSSIGGLSQDPKLPPSSPNGAAPLPIRPPVPSEVDHESSVGSSVNPLPSEMDLKSSASSEVYHESSARPCVDPASSEVYHESSTRPCVDAASSEVYHESSTRPCVDAASSEVDHESSTRPCVDAASSEVDHKSSTRPCVDAASSEVYHESSTRPCVDAASSEVDHESSTRPCVDATSSEVDHKSSARPCVDPASSEVQFMYPVFGTLRNDTSLNHSLPSSALSNGPTPDQSSSCYFTSSLWTIPHNPPNIFHTISPNSLCSTTVTTSANRPAPTLPDQMHPSPYSCGHKSYTLEFKLSVIDWVQSNKASIRSASKQFGVARKMIRTWIQSKDTLRSALVVHGPNRRKLHTGRPPLSETMDRHVLQFLQEQRSLGIQVVEKDLQRKALEIADTLGLDSFKATSAWLKRWKQRYPVVWKNGTYDICPNTTVPVHEDGQMTLKGSALLSHVDTQDKVNIRQKAKEQPSNPPSFPPDGPVELDYSKPEHSYSKPPMDPLTIEESDTTMSASPMASGELDTTSNNTDLFIRTISPSCGYDAGQGLLFDSVVDSIIVSNLSELELPLGHEEVVSSDLFVAQIGRGFIPPPKKSTCPRRGRGKAPTAVATFTGLDNPQGPAGMLANRLSQPVFPAGPEIVYIDTPNTSYSLDS